MNEQAVKTTAAGRRGVRFRLFCVLGALSALTLLSGFAAWRALDAAAEAFRGVAQETAPLMRAYAGVAARTNGLLTEAPSVLLSENDAALAKRWAAVATSEAQLDAAIGAVDAAAASPDATAAIRALADRVHADLEALLSETRAMLRARARYDALADQIEVMRQEFRLMVDAAQAGATTLNSLSGANRLITLLAETGQIERRADLPVHRARVAHALRLVRADAATLPPALRDGALGVFLGRLKFLAGAEGDVFDIRDVELAARDAAQDRVAGVQTSATALSVEIGGRLDAAQVAVGAAQARTEDALRYGVGALVAISALALAASLSIGWLYVDRGIARRLIALDGSMRAIAAGDLNTPIPAGGRDEIAAMGDALGVFRDAMADVSEAQRIRAHMDYLATHDPLTGLANRYLAERTLNEHVDGARFGCVFVVRLFGLADLLDTFGHAAVDNAIAAAAVRLEDAAQDGRLSARLDREEFALIAPGMVDPGRIAAQARRLRDDVMRPTAIQGLEVKLRAAVGVSRFPEDGDAAVALLAQAHAAAGRAQGASDLAPRLYDAELGEETRLRQRIRGDLVGAIESGAIRAWYQAKCASPDRRIAGMEALARWIDADGGSTSPSDFIPVAESSGLIADLGAAILRQACADAAAWRAQGRALRVAVNVSPAQLLGQDVTALVDETLAETGLPADLLEIEITENVLVHDDAEVMRRLKAIRDRGVLLAIDDFGAGYSSLSYLKRLPATCLKIDQAFVRGMQVDSLEDARLVRAIIGIGHDFGMEVVAEGVETTEQLDFLRNEGCDYVQGYVVARPLPPDAFRRFVQDTDASYGPGARSAS